MRGIRGLYDDLYVDLTFVDVLEKKGVDAKGQDFADAAVSTEAGGGRHDAGDCGVEGNEWRDRAVAPLRTESGSTSQCSCSVLSSFTDGSSAQHVQR
jgi:hypothetical protein